MSLRFGRDIAGDLSLAEQREWLVTNGIGGYASGTIAGSISRGYHGLLVAALRPPIDRRVMLVKLDETVTYRGCAYPLATNRWGSGAVAPDGYRNIQSFELEGSIPTWCFACGDAVVEKRVWMVHGANTTYVSYTVVSASEPVRWSADAIVDNRVFHNTGMMAWPVTVEAIADGVRVTSGGADAQPLIMRVPGAAVRADAQVYADYHLAAETDRGLNARDQHLRAATFEATLAPGATLVLMAATDDSAALDAGAFDARQTRDRELLAAWRRVRRPGAAAAPPWVEQLVLAADQFVVERPSVDQPDGKSVIAGYHWFEDWGRDTMVSLPGLSLVTGRPDVAAPILRTFARFVSQGMLPNRFPDGSGPPEYNTIDATLWYFQAIRAYYDATGDAGLVRELFPTLESIVDWHVKGTRYGIVVDPADGLLRGGQQGVQLTWMDARVGDTVITPRIGKPVEVNALWYSALRIMAEFAGTLQLAVEPFQARADAAENGFQRFWNPGTGYCFDVLDGPHGHEAALRPNQLLAVSLPHSPLPADRQRAVVDACGTALLASYGLRSLAPQDPAFCGSCCGDQGRRDAACHQGTVWSWLLGPYISAHLRVHQNPAAAMRLLRPIGDHLRAAGLGTISEIFDGDAPFPPRGCIAQAWGVGEALRAFDAIERHADHR